MPGGNVSRGKLAANHPFLTEYTLLRAPCRTRLGLWIDFEKRFPSTTLFRIRSFG
jgi:hypothetical protein